MEFKLNIWVRYLLPLFLALFFGFLIFLMGQFREPPDFEWYGLLWFVGTIYLIWECGWYISRQLSPRFPRHQFTTKRILLQLLFTNLIGILIFNGTYIVLNLYENNILGSNNPLGWIHIASATMQAFFVVQIINSFQIGYLLLINWQQLQLEAEQFRKESMAAKLESIRQQIDPHFLFNNFSTLEGLLHESPEKASNYLQKLSQLYRIVLEHLDEESITVQEELNLLQPYIDLLKVRHGATLDVHIDLSQTIRQANIPPFAFQLLLENALKHNMVLVEKPLKIRIIEADFKWISVQNNVQKRSSVINSKGIGLKNLSARCKFQTGKDIIIKQDRHFFQVLIPLIQPAPYS